MRSKYQKPHRNVENILHFDLHYLLRELCLPWVICIARLETADAPQKECSDIFRTVFLKNVQFFQKISGLHKISYQMD